MSATNTSANTKGKAATENEGCFRQQEHSAKYIYVIKKTQSTATSAIRI